MSGINDALHLVGLWLTVAFDFFVRVFDAVEQTARTAMFQAGVPAGQQFYVLLAVDAVIIVLVLKVFGGLIRALLILFLLLLIAHAVVANYSFHF